MAPSEMRAQPLSYLSTVFHIGSAEWKSCACDPICQPTCLSMLSCSSAVSCHVRVPNPADAKPKPLSTGAYKAFIFGVRTMLRDLLAGHLGSKHWCSF